MNRLKLLLLSIILIGGVFFLGYWTGRHGDWYHSVKEVIEFREGQLNKYSLINPLLACEVAEGRIDVELPSAKDQVLKVINTAKTNQKITEAGVYYRDLNNGWWFGINEREPFYPASLLKVPVMMSYYKEAEINPGVLDKKIIFKKQDLGIEVPPQNLVPAEKTLSEGESYSVSQLIEYMIRYSDNYSAAVLAQNISGERQDETFKVLHIPVPTGQSYFINPKEYGGFFRVLFNSSYLERKYSQKALELLASSEYKQGIVAGVPSELTVAHKFGIINRDDHSLQVHDCGIVYAGNKPYLICEMTRGSDLEDMQQTIAEISKAVYSQVISDYR